MTPLACALENGVKLTFSEWTSAIVVWTLYSKAFSNLLWPCLLQVKGQTTFFFVLIGCHLGTLALKTEKFSKKIGRFSKTRKWIY